MRKVLAHVAVVLGFLLLSQSAVAGGFLEIDDAVFDANSNDLTNAWWPLPEGTRFTYFVEGEGECNVVLVDVLPTAAQSRTHVAGVAVREVLDEAWLDEDCDMIPDVLLESTRDWYAQDVDGNEWYFGEDTVSFDFDECDHPDGMGGCKDGSWEAGADVAGVGTVAKEGIIMLAWPAGQTGVFYFQEYYEDEAEDMAKIMNLRTVDSPLYGEVEGCVRIKEFSPLHPGEIEHKYYCEGLGLLVVEENSGGKTVFETLIDVGPTP